MDLVSVKTAPEMTCSRIYIANSLVTGKANVLKRYFFTGDGREFRPIHSLWTPVTPKQVISGASLAEVKSTAYEGLIVKALLNDLAVVSS